jgi:DNA-binding MarR family transcriptional regulator
MTLRLIPAIHRAAHSIALLLEQPPHLGVTQGEAHILAHLEGAGPSTVAQLHRAFAHKRSTLTSILDRLEGRGLIGREISPLDRRGFVIRLTPRGKKLARRVYRRLASFESGVLKAARRPKLREFDAVMMAIEARCRRDAAVQ